MNTFDYHFSIFHFYYKMLNIVFVELLYCVGLLYYRNICEMFTSFII